MIAGRPQEPIVTPESHENRMAIAAPTHYSVKVP